MSDAIELLESLGADADLARGAPAVLDELLRREGAEPALRSALLEGDVSALRALLGSPDPVCCLINPAEPEDEEDEEEEEDEEDEEENDK